MERFLEGRPIAARPVGTLGLLARWSRRNSLLAAATSVAAMSVVVLVIVAAVAAIKQADLRRRAEAEAAGAGE